MLDRLFSGIESPIREVRAGATTFLTMAYILVVNPQILGQAGMPVEDVVLATAFSAAIATLLMGLLANYPFALAPGMGLNAFFTFGVVIGMGISYQTALAAVFIEGVLFILLTVSGARSAVINAIPHSLKIATVVGIGLFLAMIGLRNAGIVVDHPATLVALGDVTSTGVLTALFGLLVTVPLLSRRVPGSLLIGIAAATVFAAILGLVSLPDRIVSVPTLRGCRSYGHTLDKAMDNIAEAAALCLEDEKPVSGAAFVGLRDLEIVA